MTAPFRAALDDAGEGRGQRHLFGVLRNWGPVCLPVAYVILTIGPTLTAPLTLWDHWIADLVGSDGRMTLRETVNNIRALALDPDNPMRFRPLYWLLYFGEICLYGDSPLPWRVTRLVAALLCGVLLYTTARRWLSSPAASVVALSFFSGNQCEAWIRLGLQEAYGMPLLLAGLSWIAVRLSAGRSAPSELLVGYLLLFTAGLVKESLAAGLPAALVFVNLLLPYRRAPQIPRPPLSPLQSVALSLPVIGAMVTLGIVVGRFVAHGHVYGQATTYSQVAATAVNSVVTYARDTWFWLPALLAAGAWTCQPRLEPALRRRGVAQLGGAMFLAFGLLLAPQWIFYGAMGDMDHRYLMPGNLAVVVALGSAFYFLAAALAGAGQTVRAAILGAALASTIGAAWASAPRARIAAIQTRDGGHAFQASIDRIVRLSGEHPDVPIVLVAESVADFEPVIGVNRFLTRRLASGGRTFLLVTGPRKEASAYERGLLEELNRISREGQRGFAPLADIFSAARIEVRFKPTALYLGDPFAGIHLVRSDRVPK
jgi:hypothetical protein